MPLQVRSRLEEAAAADAELGWHSGRTPRLLPADGGSQPKGVDRSRAGGGEGSALLAVPTANVWAKTELLLHSLAAVRDRFDLLVRQLVAPAVVAVHNLPCDVKRMLCILLACCQWLCWRGLRCSCALIRARASS